MPVKRFPIRSRLYQVNNTRLGCTKVLGDSVITCKKAFESRRLKIPYNTQRTVAWLPDGRVALIAAFPGGGGLGLWSPDGTVGRSSAVDSSGVGFQAFSPDFRWIAYVKANQVFVRPFPGPGSPVAVSALGATEPQAH